MNKRARYLLSLLLLLAACSKSDKPVNADRGPDPVLTIHHNLYVDGSTLKDSAGNAFLMRGNNFPVFWFPDQYAPSIAAAASLGANAGRLVWQLHVESWTPRLPVLETAINECLSHRMIPIVELHDFTGGTTSADIQNAVNWYLQPDVKEMLQRYQSKLIINIANEWGGNGVGNAAWRDAYMPAIIALRNGGYTLPIMIDAPGYGQVETAIVQFGAALLAADPLKNLVFSAHAYGNWNQSAGYAARMDAILDQQLCLIFGEFGWDVPDAQQPPNFNCHVNAPLLLSLCQQKQVGYLGWSWTGNDAANACFNMSTDWADTSALTTWGRVWAYDENGVKATGRPASVF